MTANWRSTAVTLASCNPQFTTRCHGERREESSWYCVTIPLLLAAAAFSTVAAAAPQLVGDIEPNNSIITATPTGILDYGIAAIISGEIGDLDFTICGPGLRPDRDIDLYLVEVTSDATLPILLTATLDTADEQFDFYLRAFRAELVNDDPPTYQAIQIAFNDEATDGDHHALLRTYLLEPGTYLVGVSKFLPNYDPRGFDCGSNYFDPGIAQPGGARYDLFIELSPAPSFKSPFEPNEAKPTVIPWTPFFAVGEFIGDDYSDGDAPSLWLDVDKYTLDVAVPSVVSVEVRPSGFGALDPIVTVDVDGARFAAVTSLRGDLRIQRLDLGVPNPASIEITVEAVEVVPNCPLFDPSQYCQLPSPGFYDLAVHVKPVAAPQGPNEPNDSILQAAPTGLTGPGTETHSAFIGDGIFAQLRGDVDFYEFPLGIDDLFECEVIPTTETDALKPVVHLYDYLGIHVDTWMPDETGSVHVSFQRTCVDALSPPADLPETYYVAIMGAGDRPPQDLLVPNPDPDSGIPQPAFHAIDGGPGSTGGYGVTFTISDNAFPRCGDEPDDTIFDAAYPALIDEGHYICTRGMIGDGSCLDTDSDVDLTLVTVTEGPAVLNVRLTSLACQEPNNPIRKHLRLFDAMGTELAIAADAHTSRPPPPTVDLAVRFTLLDPGDYYIGVSEEYNTQYDPLLPCSGAGHLICSCTVDPGCPCDIYELDVTLIGPPESGPASPAVDFGPPDDPGRLFATRVDGLANEIVELDPISGEIARTLSPPAAPLTGAEGLAFDGTHLFLLGGGGRFPFLFRMDAETGQVLERAVTWFGSGLYGDMVAIGDELYIVDVLEDAVYVLSSALTRSVSRLDVGVNSAVSMWGSIATAGPDVNRLLVTDAGDPTLVHELDAGTGSLVSSSQIGPACPCDADLDEDGDVDDDDLLVLDDCEFPCSPWAAACGIAPECRSADLNCDRIIDAADRELLDCQRNGPGLPPNADCCPSELPPAAMRATTLAATGTDTVFSASRDTVTLERFGTSGVHLESVPLPVSVGHLAGRSFLVLGDWDRDDDIDLIDWGHLQACYTGSNATPSDMACDVFDFDFDEDVDLADFDQLHHYLTEQ